MIIVSGISHPAFIGMISVVRMTQYMQAYIDAPKNVCIRMLECQLATCCLGRAGALR